MKVHLVACSQHVDLHNKIGKYNILASGLGGMVPELDPTKYTLTVVYNNTKPLPQVYNKMVEHFATTRTSEYGYSDEDILVLVHDDVWIDERWTLFDKLVKALEQYDIVGLAGGSDAAIRQPCLWHIMCPRETHRGSVSHVNFADNSTYVTNFGPQGRVLILDGLFLAFKPKKIFDLGIKFDETVPCIAHFYDIDFSLTCNKHQLKLGTTNIKVVHSSPGLRSYTKEWLEGQDWFLNKFNRGEYNV